jgi:hypothetical protein
MSDVISNIDQSCEDLGMVDLSGINLESASPQLLDVAELDIDRHVAMQPSAMAYYGTLLKESGRRLAAYKKDTERWEKKQFAVAKAALIASNIKPVKEEVEARFYVDNEKEIIHRDNEMEKFQKEYDLLTVWYEAWKQKGFSIKQYVDIGQQERFGINASLKEENSFKNDSHDDKKRRIRDIMNKKKSNRSQNEDEN